MLNIWEENVYKKNKQINKYPNTTVVSSIFRNVRDFENKKVLDIGCGCGNNMRFFLNENFYTIGIDISKTAIDICKKNLKNYKNMELYVGNFTKLPFENEYFDVILDRAAITHNPCEFQETLEEVYRVLKNDGIFITEIFGKKSSDIIYGDKIDDNVYINYKEGDFSDSDVFFISENEISKFYKKFKILEQKKIIEENLNSNKIIEYYHLVLIKN